MAISLTICLLTYNRHEELKETLTSLKQLNYQNFQLIVGDNSANNKAEKIVKGLFPKATYYRNIPSTNEIENSNKCISLAKTEYVCLMHDDDLLLPDYFDRIVEEISANKTIDLAYTGRDMVDEKRQVIGIQQMNKNREVFIYDAKDILDYMLLGKKVEDYKVYINTPALVFKKRVFEKVKGFDKEINTHCDTNFLLKSLAVSHKVLYINKRLFINKIWYGLSGRTKSSENGEVLMAEKGVIDNLLTFCKKNKINYYTHLKEQIYNKFSIDAIAINGPLSWIALRYKGSYLDKQRSIIRTAQQIIQLNKSVLYVPRFYFVLISSIVIPQFLLKQIHKVLISHYLNKQ